MQAQQHPVFRPIRAAFTMLVIITLLPAAVVAQSRIHSRAGLQPVVPSPVLPSSASMLRTGAEPHASYWLEGGLVTGIGLLVAVMPWLLDGDGSMPVKVARAGFMVGLGFAPGALIGGLIPKQRRGSQVSGMSGLERR
jgi:hypothetical protein